MNKKRVLSGIRASGRLHLGNYLGAIKGMLELQNSPDYETFYMVADVHGITTPYNKEDLAERRNSVIIDYLAAGLDPEKSVLFIQSMVPAHLELAFYFSSVVTIARMQHLPTFKEKVKQYPEHATMALLNYPVLMASDILVYKSGLVPVGVDQEPHLEVTREIAKKMNENYGTDFPEPQRFDTPGRYIPSLLGEGKMSKSVEGSYINLTDSLDTIRQKLARVPTDSGQGSILHQNSNIANLLTFVEIFQGTSKRQEYELAYTNEGIKYKNLKDELAEAIYKELEPIQVKRSEIEATPGYVETIIDTGAEKAALVANKTVAEVKAKMGF
jgi:tryptophanyl-tRNA synthetase